MTPNASWRWSRSSASSKVGAAAGRAAVSARAAQRQDVTSAVENRLLRGRDPSCCLNRVPVRQRYALQPVVAAVVARGRGPSRLAASRGRADRPLRRSEELDDEGRLAAGPVPVRRGGPHRGVAGAGGVAAPGPRGARRAGQRVRMTGWRRYGALRPGCVPRLRATPASRPPPPADVGRAGPGRSASAAASPSPRASSCPWPPAPAAASRRWTARPGACCAGRRSAQPGRPAVGPPRTRAARGSGPVRGRR